MNKFFRRLPLQAKLMLIGFVPLAFLLYLTFQVYHDKTEKLALYDNYRQFVSQSANINALINALQAERKYSFDFTMTKGMRRELVLQRPKTDSLILKITNSGNPAIRKFTEYTKLRDLKNIRIRIDNLQSSPTEVMHFYSNTVFRMNTLNTIPPANMPYLQPLYDDLAAEKILSEMITYLGILRSNFYNVLYTKAYMIETLVGSVGSYDIYKSYEEEFYVKAAPELKQKLTELKKTSAFGPTIDYINGVFTRFSFDDSYAAADWWQVSDKGVDELLKLQSQISAHIGDTINRLYAQEKAERDFSLMMLILALIAVISIVGYISFLISRMLRELRLAAEKISVGETAFEIVPESHDAIGRLAKAISGIGENNRKLANAAEAIGKGNFDIDIQPRSDKDILVNAIKNMKEELSAYSQKMEALVKHRTEQLARSNEDLQQFAHVASHDLKEPLRKITIFSNILNEEQKDALSDRGKLYLDKIGSASQRMSHMIEGVLAYSTIAVNEQPFEDVSLYSIIHDIENDLELAIIQKEAQISYEKLPVVSGIPLLLNQLFYNLINNALKFSRPDIPPKIEISASQVIREPFVKGGGNRFWHITVSDNGIGFNSKYARQMFSVFYRLNPKDKYEGTGLGLALCKKIALRHGGDIEAEGEEGKGAVFHVYLPVH